MSNKYIYLALIAIVAVIAYSSYKRRTGEDLETVAEVSGGEANKSLNTGISVPRKILQLNDPIATQNYKVMKTAIDNNTGVLLTDPKSGKTQRFNNIPNKMKKNIVGVTDRLGTPWIVEPL